MNYSKLTDLENNEFQKFTIIFIIKKKKNK